MQLGLLGQMVTPNAGNVPVPRTWYAIDNGRFSKLTWRPDAWRAKLREFGQRQRCLFCVVPDEVGDAQRTREMWDEFRPSMGGYRTAFVTQDGCTPDLVPWGEFDCLFNGGSTEWKLSEAARRLTKRAQELHLWTHMGRVNSLKRLRVAEHDGYDSVDGTYLAFGPDKNLPRLLRWLDQAAAEAA